MGEPTVTTEGATSVAQTTATVNAMVNPNGSKVSDCKFEYGTSESYGSTAACTQTVGEGTTNVAVSAPLTSLTPNTTYHFRISATNGNGTSKGTDATLTTQPLPPTLKTKPANPLAQTTATLNGSVNPNGSEVTECKLEYGTTTSYGASASCTPEKPGSGTAPVNVSAMLTSLAENTTYHFRLVAKNGGGTSETADATFTTLPNAPTVKTEAASLVAPTGATLNATVNPNGGEVTKCELEFGTTTAYGKTAPCTPAPGSGSTPVTVSAAVGGLAENTTYHFRIVATNAGGKSEGLDEAFKTTSKPGVKTEPASSVAQTTATVNATVNPNGFEVTECKFEYGTSETYGSIAPCAQAPGAGTSAVPVSAGVTGLAANTTYHFRISATNANGTTKGADLTLKTPPDPPTVVTEAASAVTQSGASLNATVNANGGPVNACSFEYGPTAAYGSVVPCPALPPSGEVRLTVTIAGLAANTTYHYRISAGNQGGASVGADQTFTTAAPPAPSGSQSPGTTTRVTTVVVVPDSTFKVLGATLNLRNYWITFTESVHDPGTFTWVLTFKNGPFGAFAASRKACRAGRVRLKGRCRPSKVLFAKGSQYVPAPGNASFTVVPTSAGVSALKEAFKRKMSLPVRAVVIFQSTHGGPSVTHIQKLVVKLRK